MDAFKALTLDNKRFIKVARREAKKALPEFRSIQAAKLARVREICAVLERNFGRAWTPFTVPIIGPSKPFPKDLDEVAPPLRESPGGRGIPAPSTNGDAIGDLFSPGKTDTMPPCPVTHG